MTSAIDLIHRAIDLSDNERYTDAISLLTTAISIDPRIAQAYFERLMAYLNLDQNAAAAADFDRALSVDPNFPGARDWRSRAAESLRRLTSCRGRASQGPESQPRGAASRHGREPARMGRLRTRSLMNGKSTRQRASFSKDTSRPTRRS